MTGRTFRIKQDLPSLNRTVVIDQQPMNSPCSSSQYFSRRIVRSQCKGSSNNIWILNPPRSDGGQNHQPEGDANSPSQQPVRRASDDLMNLFAVKLFERYNRLLFHSLFAGNWISLWQVPTGC